MVGGAGFIGSHTADELILQGARVAIVDNLSSGKKENCSPRARFYKVDATSASALAGVFQKEKPQFVFMFAALTNVPRALREPLLDSRSIAALVNVCDYAVRYGVKKLLFASSGFIYGNARKRPTPETETCQSFNPYSISKAACENYLKFFRMHHGLRSVVLRYGTVYGPRQVGGAIADYIHSIYGGKRAEIFGIKARDYIFISDAVRANLLAMEKDNYYKSGPIFNISGGRETNLRDVYALVAKLLNRSENKPKICPDRVGEIKRLLLDINRARRTLHFLPEVSLEEGMQKTVDWFLANLKDEIRKTAG